MPAERVRVALASRNRGKLRELRTLLPEWEIEALDTTGIGEEEGSTFHENACAKALFARGRADPGKWALGEDSGLEVDGLHGAPGIRSARYAGDEATDEENLRRLLDELELLEGGARRARYICELVLISPSGKSIAAGERSRERSGARRAAAAASATTPSSYRLGRCARSPSWVMGGRRVRATVPARRGRFETPCSARHPIANARCASVPAVEAAEALADLTEISTQIRLAVLVDERGELVASAGAEPAQADTVARLVRELLSAAEDAMGGRRRASSSCSCRPPHREAASSSCGTRAGSLLR